MSDRRPLRVRFLARVSPEPTSGCWLWTGAVNSNGYGVIGDGGRKEGAHRVSWRLNVGHIPAGLHVLHRCDNPPCVNPAHLFLGDAAANMADKMAKGRGRWVSGDNHPRRLDPSSTPRGAKHYLAVLTEASVLLIRQRFAAGEPVGAIAHDFGVAPSTVSAVVRGKNWRHVGGPVSERCGRAVTPNVAAEIRLRRARGEDMRAIAKAVGVGKSTVHRVLHS